MKSVISLYKPVGISPVQLINTFKEQNPEYKDVKISPAGKLDPLAHGVMVLLVGDENKKRREYELSDKVYQFQAVIGFGTDSYDICGLSVIGSPNIAVSDESLKNILRTYKGKQRQKFPPFSSYKIKGKPLFNWALRNKLNEITIPEKEIEIYDIKLLNTKYINGHELYTDIKERISLLKGNFRQEEIMKRWENNIEIEKRYQVIEMEAHVSSGTYIRGIVNDLGIRIGAKATAIEINRIRSGKYTVNTTQNPEISL